MFSLKMFVNVMTKKTPDDKSIKTKNIKITEKNGRENYYRRIYYEKQSITNFIIAHRESD